jgi:glucose/mannose-6-phosphate isomerase
VSDRGSIDSADMLGKIKSFPGQLLAGFDLGSDAWRSVKAAPRVAVIAGMGASATGGDLLRLYLFGRSRVPVFVFRDFEIPLFAGRDSLVVVSSYSGDTEEALSCLDGAIAQGAYAVCVTSGGRLLREARSRSLPHVVLPAGFPPRASMGYSFSALLALAWKVGLCADPSRELRECAEYLEETSLRYSNDASGNEASSLAADLGSRIPVICCSGALDAVGLRWKNQFCENSKRLAFVSVFPEANHNDVMGWERCEIPLEAAIVVLRTADEHPSVAQVLSQVGEVFRGKAHFSGEFWGRGSSLLSRMFSLILLGDYASYYLALRSGVDPTPIATIEKIKSLFRSG